jgi:hypothetical protein
MNSEKFREQEQSKNRVARKVLTAYAIENDRIFQQKMFFEKEKKKTRFEHLEGNI